MKSRIPYAVAALLAAGAVSIAAAQGDKDVSRVDTSANPKAPSAMSDANVPNTRPDVTSSGSSAAGQKPNPAPTLNFAKEPIASASTTQGAEGQLAGTIVEALNADPALNQSKISVQPVDGQIVLSGAALTQAQKEEATRIAASKAGETKIVNTIQTDDV